MGFRLVIGPDAADEEYDEDASFTFNPHGLLVIESEGQRTTFAPGSWQRLVTAVPVGTTAVRR